MEISSFKFEQEDGKWKTPSQPLTFNSKEGTATATFAEPLKPGKGSIHAIFTGILNDKLDGFYRSKYTNSKGEETYMAVTQFESTFARKAFPCWDEPAYKAYFDVTLKYPSGLTAISNMPIISSDEDAKANTTTSVFERSPLMSTYLLAFVIGEFDFVEATTTERKVKIRVYTPVGKSDQGKFALDVAVKTIPFYEEFFAVEYPLPKCDLIAIPDFAAGAMENWGCITYRETALLVDAKNSSAMTKQWVVRVVGHELAHMWFGNLVTMEWWKDLWLNEGFASWVEIMCVDYCFPEWKIWPQFIEGDVGNGLRLDALLTTHPVEVEVYDANEVDEIFDAISYEKGAALIAMLDDYIGRDLFKKGLQFYLQKWKYKNAETKDLWDAFAQVCDDDRFTEMMEKWTQQPGFPVVSVRKHADANTIAMKYRRFYGSTRSCTEDVTNAKGYKWIIPVNITYQTTDGQIKTLDRQIKATEGSSKPQPRRPVLCADADASEQTFTLNDWDSKSGWVKVNAGQNGYFRVNYALDMKNALVTAVQKKGQLPDADRLGILSDALALAKSGEGATATRDLLVLLQAYKEEEDYTVWRVISRVCGDLDVLAGGLGVYEEWCAFARDLFSVISKKVGGLDELVKSGSEKAEGSHVQNMMRSLVIGRMGKYGDPETVKQARELLGRFLDEKDSFSLPADVRSVVYGTVVMHSESDKEWNQLLKRYEAETLQEEQERCLYALGKTKQADLLKKTIDFVLSDKVRTADAPYALRVVGQNPHGGRLLWDLGVAKWDGLTKVFKGSLVRTLVSGMMASFVTEEHAAMAEKFFKEHPLEDANRAVKQCLEKIRDYAWWAKHCAEMKSWLDTSAQ